MIKINKKRMPREFSFSYHMAVAAIEWARAPGTQSNQINDLMINTYLLGTGINLVIASLNITFSVFIN